MIDKNILRKIGWSDDLINSVADLAEKINLSAIQQDNIIKSIDNCNNNSDSTTLDVSDFVLTSSSQIFIDKINVI
jgi:hypothetical protein